MKYLFVMLMFFITVLFDQNVNAMQLNSDQTCLSAAIYFEAGNQTLNGKYAVGLVIINRVKSKRFPNTICGVVKQHKQFSFYSDGKPEKVSRNKLEQEQWHISQTIADILLHNNVIDFTHGSLFYHSDKVKLSWTKTLRITLVIQSHIFYSYR